MEKFFFFFSRLVLSGHAVWVSVIKTGTPDTENNQNYKSCIHGKVFTFADLCFPVMQIPALTTFGVQFCALQLTVNVLSQLTF